MLKECEIKKISVHQIFPLVKAKETWFIIPLPYLPKNSEKKISTLSYSEF